MEIIILAAIGSALGTLIVVIASLIVNRLLLLIGQRLARKYHKPWH